MVRFYVQPKNDGRGSVGAKDLQKWGQKQNYFLIQIDENLIHLKVRLSPKGSRKLFSADPVSWIGAGLRACHVSREISNRVWGECAIIPTLVSRWLITLSATEVIPASKHWLIMSMSVFQTLSISNYVLLILDSFKLPNNNKKQSWLCKLYCLMCFYFDRFCGNAPTQSKIVEQSKDVIVHPDCQKSYVLSLPLHPKNLRSWIPHPSYSLLYRQQGSARSPY